LGYQQLDRELCIGSSKLLLLQYANDKSFLRHFPTIDNQLHLNIQIQRIQSPKWPYLAPAEGKEVTATYLQWTSTREPPPDPQQRPG